MIRSGAGAMRAEEEIPPSPRFQPMRLVQADRISDRGATDSAKEKQKDSPVPPSVLRECWRSGGVFGYREVRKKRMSKGDQKLKPAVRRRILPATPIRRECPRA